MIGAGQREARSVSLTCHCSPPDPTKHKCNSLSQEDNLYAQFLVKLIATAPFFKQIKVGSSDQRAVTSA